MYLLIHYGIYYGTMNAIPETKSNVQEIKQTVLFNIFSILNRGCGCNRGNITHRPLLNENDNMNRCKFYINSYHNNHKQILCLLTVWLCITMVIQINTEQVKF